MEAATGETELLQIGRFSFSLAGFEKAAAIIRQYLQHPGWLIIDEIGPLEIKGLGFNAVYKEVLATRKERTLIVVRESLAEEVQTFFGQKGRLIRSVEELDAIS